MCSLVPTRWFSRLTWAWAVVIPVAILNAQSDESSRHPDAARATAAKWQRLAIIEMSGHQSAQQERQAENAVISLHFSANGWGVIINPDGAVAIARRESPDAPPVSMFAAAGAIDFPKIRSRLLKEVSKPQKKTPAAFLGGVRMNGDRNAVMVPVFDLRLWNDIIIATEGRLDPAATGTYKQLVAKFPILLTPHVEPIAAK